MATWKNSTHFRSHSDCRSNLKETCNLNMHGHVILVSIYLVLTAVTWSSHRCSIHVCQDCMPRLTYFLKYGCHAVHHHRGCKVHTFAIHVASHFDHEKKGMHGFLFLCMHVVPFLWLYGALLDTPSGCQTSAIKFNCLWPQAYYPLCGQRSPRYSKIGYNCYTIKTHLWEPTFFEI